MTEYNISRQALWLFCGFVVSLTLVCLALPCGAVAGLALGVVRQLTAWEHCPAEQRGRVDAGTQRLIPRRQPSRPILLGGGRSSGASARSRASRLNRLAAQLAPRVILTLVVVVL